MRVRAWKGRPWVRFQIRQFLFFYMQKEVKVTNWLPSKCEILLWSFSSLLTSLLCVLTWSCPWESYQMFFALFDMLRVCVMCLWCRCVWGCSPVRQRLGGFHWPVAGCPDFCLCGAADHHFGHPLQRPSSAKDRRCWGNRREVSVSCPVNVIDSMGCQKTFVLEIAFVASRAFR